MEQAISPHTKEMPNKKPNLGEPTPLSPHAVQAAPSNWPNHLVAAHSFRGQASQDQTRRPNQAKREKKAAVSELRGAKPGMIKPGSDPPSRSPGDALESLGDALESLGDALESTGDALEGQARRGHPSQGRGRPGQASREHLEWPKPGRNLLERLRE